MGDDGDTKDDVKVPDGEVGDKIEKLFRTDEKDTSESFNCQQHEHSANFQPRRYCPYCYGRRMRYRREGSSPWLSDTIQYSNDACVRKGHGCLFFTRLPYLDFKAVDNVAKQGIFGLLDTKKVDGVLDPPDS